MRQLFKGVIALSKGNYKRQITLLTNIFTPREIVFIADEFNNMVNEINDSYKKLKTKNKELKLLDAFRSNLVDTVSHELRTPLTSIRGYTSRLLRTDIEIDEETKHKSLLIIKQINGESRQRRVVLIPLILRLVRKPKPKSPSKGP
jgi:signal transduction histidine kinase